MADLRVAANKMSKHFHTEPWNTRLSIKFHSSISSEAIAQIYELVEPDIIQIKVYYKNVENNRLTTLLQTPIRLKPTTSYCAATRQANLEISQSTHVVFNRMQTDWIFNLLLQVPSDSIRLRADSVRISTGDDLYHLAEMHEIIGESDEESLFSQVLKMLSDAIEACSFTLISGVNNHQPHEQIDYSIANWICSIGDHPWESSGYGMSADELGLLQVMVCRNQASRCAARQDWTARSAQ